MIEVSHLTKTFGDLRAVNDVSFTVGAGECVGFLGPNGAGKTTTMRVATGIFPPSAGTVRVAGFDVQADPVRARSQIGYFPEHAPFYPELSVEGYLGWVARAKRLDRGRRSSAIDRALEACDLIVVRRRLVGKLSKGFRQRVGLAQALLGDPPVLILDEPTAGLDPEQVAEIRALVKGLRGERTVLFSSHVLSEVSQVAQRVVIIHRGEIVAEDTPENLTQRLAGAITLRLRVEASDDAVSGVLARLPAVRGVSVVDGTFRLTADDEDAVREVSRAISAQGWTTLELAHEKLSLEEIFLRLIGSRGDAEP